ncbi:GNAT family N-acetyltransferase [Paracoccus sp. TK19116]|uniref:L-ornithine N(alpha)-acyltransferase n=1 Tax=Paracoccus albicereus TaxID=2922394 RepID=A0ABT1MP55_9RHOB|nr:GNAT family N-acetyltransferase [Paracoccus albicereus]MCQ0970075.1 GNAT family N-acetyltransferase [Paracoccus albicereus]
MLAQRRSRYHLHVAATAEDLRTAQRLRWLCFMARHRPADDPDMVDSDDLDPLCTHMLIEEAGSGQLVCCFRFLHLRDGSEIARSYSARHYDLSPLADFDGPMVELGRFCIHPGWRDPDILRLAWAELTRFVDANGVRMLFGCSSFLGADPDAHAEALAILRERHIAPRRWLPRVKAPQVFRFARVLARRRADPRAALAAMPPLLRSYLVMGGWVSDHAVVDRDLDTLHVFTGLEIGAIPAARQRLLRRAAG